MATDTETQAQETVSKEAFDRRMAEIDELKAQNSQLTEQLAAKDKVYGTQLFLRDQGFPPEEIPARMELLAPHLPELPVDGLTEALSADKFKPLVTASATPPVPTDGNDGTPPASPFPPDGGFGSQPSPASDGQPVQTGGKVGPGDADYEAARQAAQRGDHSKMQALYDNDRVSEPQSPWF